MAYHNSMTPFAVMEPKAQQYSEPVLFTYTKDAPFNIIIISTPRFPNGLIHLSANENFVCISWFPMTHPISLLLIQSP